MKTLLFGEISLGTDPTFLLRRVESLTDTGNHQKGFNEEVSSWIMGNVGA